MMSPITHFVIYYGRDETALMNYTTTHTEPTRYNMSGWTEKGEWLVGVASANNAGIGQASYTDIGKCMTHNYEALHVDSNVALF